MTEYEQARMLAEAEAMDCHAMSMQQIHAARDVGQLVLRRVGLTPERVWALTRDMRINGGEL